MLSAPRTFSNTQYWRRHKRMRNEELEKEKNMINVDWLTAKQKRENER